MSLSERVKKLIEGKNFGFLATLKKDGSPHVTPVWVDHADGDILVNTTTDRAKVRHVKNDPRVAIAIVDNQDPYKYAMVQGKVIEVTENGAEEHIDKLAFKYTGMKKYQKARKDEKRVIIKIRPVKVIEHL